MIHEYVSDNTYLCGYKPTDLSKIRALPFVVWANVYLQGFKVAPALRADAGVQAEHILPQALPPSHSRTLHRVDVVFHEDVKTNAPKLKTAIAAAAHLNPDDIELSRRKVRLTVQERYLDDLAAIDEVRHIEEVPEVKLRNNVARPILNAQVVVGGTTFAGKGRGRRRCGHGVRQGFDFQRPSRVYRARRQTLRPGSTGKDR